MLEHARNRVPDGEFHLAGLERLPLPADHVDLAVCGLALVHLTDLRPAFAELARVLRPGGHLVVTDVHRDIVELGSVPHVRTADGDPRLLPQHPHRISDYLGAALPQGLELRRCEEPRPKTSGAAPADEPLALGPPSPWDTWPWSLMAMTPAATRAAWGGAPGVLLLHFQKRAITG
ncbi:MAG TPA: class I SAM-dependent methyltransferase, partial [Actinoplanes sp.]